MGTHTYYTHRQACRLLDIDGKTLNKWLQGAHIEVQPDPKDTRVKRLTRTQLLRLATLHKVDLPEDDETLLGDQEQMRSLRELTLDMERLEQSLVTLTEVQQKRFEQMQQLLVDAIEMRLADVSKNLLVELDALLQKQLPQALAESVLKVMATSQEEMREFIQAQMAALLSELRKR